MKQSYNLLCSMAMAALLTPVGTATAQSRHDITASGPSVLKTEAEPKTTPVDQYRALADFKAKHPLLFKAKVRGENGVLLKDISSLNKLGTTTSRQGMKAARVKRQPAKATPQPMILKSQQVSLGRELWGNVLYSNKWEPESSEYGMYRFGASASVETEGLFLSPYMYANAGGAVANGKIDIVTYNSYYQQMIHYRFDTKDGSYVDGSYLNDYSLWSTETAVAADGTVYAAPFAKN